MPMMQEERTLTNNKEYNTVKSLRYGHLMIMKDQDYDGSHIKGLLINFKEILGNNANGWKIKYYKGEGPDLKSSTANKDEEVYVILHIFDSSIKGVMCMLVGKVYILLLEADNVATIIDPKILKHLMENNVEYCMEDQPIPVLEIVRDQDKPDDFKLIDTSNTWVNLRAIKWLVNTGRLTNEILSVSKEKTIIKHFYKGLQLDQLYRQSVVRVLTNQRSRSLTLMQLMLNKSCPHQESYIGKVYILLLDADNVATIIDPSILQILKHLMENNVEYCMEDQPIPLIYTRAQFWRSFEIQINFFCLFMVDGFYLKDDFKLIDTSNMWVTLRAIKWLVNTGRLTNEILSFSKEKDNNQAFLQGTVAGSAIQAVCGESTNKPKEQIVDIDAADAGNELAAVEYIEDICKFYTLSKSCPHQKSYIGWWLHCPQQSKSCPHQKSYIGWNDAICLLHQIETLNLKYRCRVPVILQNRVDTHDDTLKVFS
ncbi:hypothetical protein L6164_025261 [Bauhinia variegata]|uniref:Uncharacterized protein n=1 Tax=Bauhinia variegata TaxID=167791 RepID=A0ACB9M1N0_BAUVA|nr:hypothetical protein L6164_025261 [Bauhinia variegata]